MTESVNRKASEFKTESLCVKNENRKTLERGADCAKS